jgi:hypothetical protein
MQDGETTGQQHCAMPTQLWAIKISNWFQGGNNLTEKYGSSTLM